MESQNHWVVEEDRGILRFYGIVCRGVEVQDLGSPGGRITPIKALAGLHRRSRLLLLNLCRGDESNHLGSFFPGEVVNLPELV